MILVQVALIVAVLTLFGAEAKRRVDDTILELERGSADCAMIAGGAALVWICAASVLIRIIHAMPW